MKLQYIFKKAARLFGAGPQFYCYVDGFDTAIKRMDNNTFELRIRANGQNPDYPAADQDTILRVDHDTECRRGFVDGRLFVEKNTKYKAFELVEAFDSARAYHGVVLRAKITTFGGYRTEENIRLIPRQSTITLAQKQNQPDATI